MVQSSILDRFPDEEGKAKVVSLCCRSASLVSHFFPFGLKFSVEQVRLVQRFPTMFRELLRVVKTYSEKKKKKTETEVRL